MPDTIPPPQDPSDGRLPEGISAEQFMTPLERQIREAYAGLAEDAQRHIDDFDVNRLEEVSRPLVLQVEPEVVKRDPQLAAMYRDGLLTRLGIPVHAAPIDETGSVSVGPMAIDTVQKTDGTNVPVYLEYDTGTPASGHEKPKRPSLIRAHLLTTLMAHDLERQLAEVAASTSEQVALTEAMLAEFSRQLDGRPPEAFGIELDALKEQEATHAKGFVTLFNRWIRRELADIEERTVPGDRYRLTDKPGDIPIGESLLRLEDGARMYTLRDPRTHTAYLVGTVPSGQQGADPDFVIAKTVYGTQKKNPDFDFVSVASYGLMTDGLGNYRMSYRDGAITETTTGPLRPGKGLGAVEALLNEVTVARREFTESSETSAARGGRVAGALRRLRPGGRKKRS